VTLFVVDLLGLGAGRFVEVIPESSHLKTSYVGCTVPFAPYVVMAVFVRLAVGSTMRFRREELGWEP
jgi:hypothetical protein